MNHSIPSIACERLHQFLTESTNVQIIDVRSVGEYRAGHIPGSIHIPYEEIQSRLEDVTGDRPAVLVCQSGTRANIACDLIIQSRSNATVLMGGFAEWCKAKYPVVVAQISNWSLERQVRFTAGLIILIGLILGTWVNPWLYMISAFIGVGLTFSGITNFCGMGVLMSKMPWNQPIQKEIKNVQS